MELTQLRYFLEAASTQHITRSAQKLHIAQPALTRAIRRLEEDIGVPLFESHGRNIVLNEYGRHLQQAVAPIVAYLDKIPEELRRMAKLDKDTVRLNVLAASIPVTEAIVAYKRQHDANFSVFQNNGDSSDIEITTRVPHSGHSDNEFVITEKIFLAVPKNKFSGSKVRLKELENEDFICLLGSGQFRAICDKFCHHAGFKPKIIFESDNPTAVRNVIAANMGVGFWPEFTWGNAESEHVKLVEISDLPFGRDIVISYNPRASQTAENFFGFLKEFFISLKNASTLRD